MTSPSRLSDDQLIAEVKRLAICERAATVELVTHLVEFDKRQLHLAAGFSSLFDYCRDVLHLSEHAAYHRILACRAARRFPSILPMLASGSLNLTSVRLVARYLTQANHRELLAAASGKTKRALEELLARRFPQPELASIRKLPNPTSPLQAPSRAAAPERPTAMQTCSPLSSSPAGFPHPAPHPPRHIPVVIPIAADRYKITFTAAATTREKLELAQDMLRHVFPDGDTAAIIERALTALLENLARQKFAATDRPRPGRGTADGSRHLPAEVKRTVWLRDLGRCAFTSPDGRRCNARAFVEFHHVKPFAAGGPPTVDNIQLRCSLCRARHNVHYAERRIMPSRRIRTAKDAVVIEKRSA